MSSASEAFQAFSTPFSTPIFMPRPAVLGAFGAHIEAMITRKHASPDRYAVRATRAYIGGLCNIPRLVCRVGNRSYCCCLCCVIICSEFSPKRPPVHFTVPVFIATLSVEIDRGSPSEQRSKGRLFVCTISPVLSHLAHGHACHAPPVCISLYFKIE